MHEHFNGKLGSYKIVKTEDGSITLYSEYFQQSCHSNSGAKEETIFNYILPCKVIERAKSGPLNILEVGYGLGHGVLETFKLLDQQEHCFPIHFVSLELDETLIHWSQKNNNQDFQAFPSLSNLSLLEKENYKIYQSQKNIHTLDIVIGDATLVLKKYLQDFPIKFDAIYQDAFSPDHNPELWSQSWFDLLYQSSHQDCIMSTYSCAGVVKKNLKATQWDIKKREGFKKKREALLIKKI